MNYIHRFIAMSCIVATITSVAMDKDQNVLQVSSLSEILGGTFIDQSRMVLTGLGSTILYNVKTKSEKKIYDDPVFCTLTKCGSQIAAFDLDNLLIYNDTTDQVTKMPWQMGNQSCAGNCTGDKLFIRTGGDVIVLPEGQDVVNDSSILHIIDCTNYKVSRVQVPCEKNVGANPPVACHPLKDLITYTSGRNILTTVMIENGSVKNEDSIIIDNVTDVVTNTIYSPEGTHIAVQGVTTNWTGGIELHMYECENKKSHYYGNVHGMDFFKEVIAILRSDATVDYWDFKNNIRIHRTEDSLICEGNLRARSIYTIQFSPDGKMIFVTMPDKKETDGERIKAFLIPVPAVVYAYNKAKAERK